MSGETSKPIKKTDDESKRFIIDCLGGENTHGFDVDSVYYYKGCWCLFEYLTIYKRSKILPLELEKVLFIVLPCKRREWQTDSCEL